jgi:hypothetical protein
MKTPKSYQFIDDSSGCRDFLLKPELLRAISDLGFEHPSEGFYFPRIHFFLTYIL